jgi:type IV pilus assembly protein PilW
MKHPQTDRCTPMARRERGFTIVELMVGMLIGLLAVIVITQVMLISEGQKRTTTGGSDAQVNGALALYTVQRNVEMAGYGILSSRDVVGCPISALYQGNPITRFPTRLAPVVITRQADRAAALLPAGPGDAIRVMSSSKTSFSVPTRVTPPGFAKAAGLSFPVTAALGVQKDDLALVAVDSVTPCWVIQATADATGESIPRDDNATWNRNGTPDQVYGDGSVLINLGTLIDTTYLTDGSVLKQESFDPSAPNTRITSDVQPDIVNMRALYGKDTSNDGVIDAYDDVTPTTNAQWLQVLAVRVVIVARSGQFEKEDVTSAELSWDVGLTLAMTTAGVVNCGASRCLPLKLDHLGADWKRYRYKQFETVIPLRNMLWSS